MKKGNGWLALALILALILCAWLALGQELPARDVSAESGIVISELCAKNTAILADNQGRYPDYIELHNTTAQDLDLAGCTLTDGTQRPYLLVVKAGSGQAAEPVEKALEGSRMAYRLSSMTDTAAGVELIYELGFRPDCTDAVLALKQLEGVTAVTLVDCKKG